jgi:hypothetical protein
MNDFTRLLYALGRGIIKILISALVGVGIGMLVFGIQTAGRPDMFEMRRVPGELFIGLGSGLLSGGGMLLALFLIPWLMRRPPEPALMDEPPLVARPAPRPPRSDPDDYPRPLANPPREEPGTAGFFEK